MHLIDEGWTLAIFSDHALISCEVEAVAMGDNTGVSLEPLHKMGYTVLKTDENGKELPEVDWTKTKAIMTRSNSIYINVKGRDPHGIVDPADKYELEEQIITDLYGYKHPKTGHRIFDLAVHNKEAVLFGLGGPMGSDIVFFVNENYAEDHGAGLSTATGHNDTSLGPNLLRCRPRHQGRISYRHVHPRGRLGTYRRCPSGRRFPGSVRGFARVRYLHRARLNNVAVLGGWAHGAR